MTEQAVATLDAMGLGLVFEVLDHVNAKTYLKTGTALSDDDFERIQRSSRVLLGAVGDPQTDKTPYARRVVLRIRSELDLYVNKRPARLLHDRLSPLHEGMPRAINCVVVRENTEGLYVGIGGALREGTEDAVVMDVEVNTHYGVRRVLDYAFDIARTSVCMVDKANAVPNGGRLWQRCWTEAAQRHPGVESWHEYVDAAAMKLVSEPDRFDVIVTNNTYGDILSDIAAEIAGGIRHRRQRQYQPPDRSRIVRTYPRHRAGHRGDGYGQPGRRHSVRSAAAGELGPVSRGRGAP